jgi:hypothetical protein
MISIAAFQFHTLAVNSKFSAPRSSNVKLIVDSRKNAKGRRSD